jgi:phosphoribosylamine--glycine ligase
VRILGLSQRLYLGDIHLALKREGHDVRVFASDPPALRAFGGLLDTIDDWQAGLDWVGRDGVVLVEGVRQGAAQDALRARGHRVVGGSAYGDRLENDRDFGQATLRDAGLPIAQSRAFDTPADALAWLGAHPGRYVLKHDDGAHPTFVGEHATGADLAFQLRRAPPGRVLLMPRLDGVEVGVGAYFDGRAFLRPACIDFEHKRFFPAELGEMTGEMGTLASFEHAEPLFAHTLDRMAPAFRAAGHVGYVNLNLIVNEQGAWPLEFTCRIGNPGFAVLAALQPAGWGDLLARMAGGLSAPPPPHPPATPSSAPALSSTPAPPSALAPSPGPAAFPTRPGWSVAIVLTVPPFPGVAPAALPEDDPPVFFHRDPFSLPDPGGAELLHHHFVDMRRDRHGEEQLRVHRRSGHAMIVTGVGATVRAAQDAARARARNVVIPELRWRADIGDRFAAGEAARLASLGWLPAACSAPPEHAQPGHAAQEHAAPGHAAPGHAPPGHAAQEHGA